MSQDDSLKSGSQSESTGSSPNTAPFFQEHFIKDLKSDRSDLRLFGSPAPTLVRRGTVKRVNSIPIAKKELESVNADGGIEDSENNIVLSKLDSNSSTDQSVSSRYRKSLDSTFRRSLESISEHKTKRSFSPTLSLSNARRNCSSSLESIASDQTDYAVRSSTLTRNERTIQSPASSYLSWIESVNSEYFGSTTSRAESTDLDNKVGEWNNFWLNYSSQKPKARSCYLSSPYVSADDRIGDDDSEAKSTSSTQKELTEKNSSEYISLNLHEIHEVLRCSRRITEIFQNALIRNDHDCENSNNENSYYSGSFSHQNSLLREENVELITEDLQKIARERSASYIISSQDLIKQKEMLKTTVQSSSNNCINALLSTGVADILKKVINRRRDVVTPDDLSSVTRHSFSEWSSK